MICVYVSCSDGAMSCYVNGTEVSVLTDVATDIGYSIVAAGFLGRGKSISSCAAVGSSVLIGGWAVRSGDELTCLVPAP